MRFFYDTEFIEDGETIELISIGIVGDGDDPREYYAVNSDAPWGRIRNSEWLMRNVVPSLPITGVRSLHEWLNHPSNCYPKPSLSMVELDTSSVLVKPKWVIANEVREFLLAEGKLPELWAYYGAYDHVALCQLWGSMMALPEGIPMFTNDIMQEASRVGVVPPKQPSGEHNALSDAHHVKNMFWVLQDLNNQGE